MANFKDESFIQQYLSPKVIRDLKLFCVIDDDKNKDIEIAAIHDKRGYQRIRESLAGMYNLGNREPNIQVYNVDISGDRSLTLHHSQYERKPMGEGTDQVLKHIHRLWGFDVHLHSIENNKTTKSYHYPEQATEDSEH